MRHEGDTVLAEDIHLVSVEVVVLSMLAHREPESLADDVVKGDREEEPSKHHQDDAINSIKLTPLGLLLKDIVNLDGLSSFLDGKRRFVLKLSNGGVFMVVRVKNLVLFDFIDLAILVPLAGTAGEKKLLLCLYLVVN